MESEKITSNGRERKGGRKKKQGENEKKER